MDYRVKTTGIRVVIRCDTARRSGTGEEERGRGAERVEAARSGRGHGAAGEMVSRRQSA